MDEALKSERLELHLKHADATQKIVNLRAEQMEHHKRITQIDRIELRENLSLDGEDLAIDLGGGQAKLTGKVG
jgi:hypothetical protein